MTDRGRIVLAAVVCGAALLLAAGLAGAMHRDRALARARHATALATQARALATRFASTSAAPPRVPRRACVTGVETFATAVERTAVPLPPPGGGRASRLAALLELSDRAVAAEREAELARPAPTLPKRMGAVAATRDAEGRRVWTSLVPERRACDGTAFAELTVGWADAARARASKSAGKAVRTDGQRPAAAPAKRGKPTRKAPARGAPSRRTRR